MEVGYLFGLFCINSIFSKFALNFIKNAVFFGNNINVFSNLSLLIFKEGNLVCQSEDIEMPVICDKGDFSLLFSEVDDILKQLLVFNHDVFVDEKVVNTIVECPCQLQPAFVPRVVLRNTIVEVGVSQGFDLRNEVIKFY